MPEGDEKKLAEAEPQPPAAEPRAVPPNAIVVRLLPCGTGVLKGDDLQASAFTPTGSRRTGDSGPSLYVLDDLDRGTDDIDAARTEWASYGHATCTVAEMQALGLRVVYTPDECDLPALRHAHASIANLTKAMRVKLLSKMSIKRRPQGE
jgi:hypothetical protein